MLPAEAGEASGDEGVPRALAPAGETTARPEPDEEVERRPAPGASTAESHRSLFCPTSMRERMETNLGKQHTTPGPDPEDTMNDPRGTRSTLPNARVNIR